MRHADARGIKAIEAPRNARAAIVVGRSCPISPKSLLDDQKECFPSSLRLTIRCFRIRHCYAITIIAVFLQELS
jgi:hypothetical protein